MQEKKKRNIKNAPKRLFIFVICAIAALALVCVSLLLSTWISHSKKAFHISQTISRLEQSGYVALSPVMQLLGYEESEQQYTFTKQDSGVDIIVTYDIEKGACYKNGYTFSLTNATIFFDDVCYIQQDTFTEITNATIQNEDGVLSAQTKTYTSHEWTQDFAPLVCHAGGAMRKSDSNTTYTNSLDAVIQNYNLGHRVFEIDFSLTDDHRLAAVHNWDNFGNMNGIPMSSEEWKNLNRVAEIDCKTILIEDILDQMVINKDMFIVTDTKTSRVGEEMTEEFRIIRDEALKRDPALLDRIIPQIYNREMYSVVTGIYPFQSIIFTLYITNETDEEVLAFVANHDDIKVITTWGDTGRTHLSAPLADMGKLVYAHTHNNYWDIQRLYQKGVYGIYTDFLTPWDIEVYNQYASSAGR